MRINSGAKIDSLKEMLNKFFADDKPIPKDELAKWVEEDIIFIAITESFITESSTKNMYVISAKGKQYINNK